VRIQLETAGVGEVEVLRHCTRCDSEKLWSYRREGKGAGRNVAFLWRA
jgi:copper oxidase (laccase) domain-containing protein